MKRKGDLRRLQLISTDDWDITDTLDHFQDIMDILQVLTIILFTEQGNQI